jgi:hypothetical protein
MNPSSWGVDTCPTISPDSTTQSFIEFESNLKHQYRLYQQHFFYLPTPLISTHGYNTISVQSNNALTGQLHGTMQSFNHNRSFAANTTQTLSTSANTSISSLLSSNHIGSNPSATTQGHQTTIQLSTSDHNQLFSTSYQHPTSHLSSTHLRNPNLRLTHPGLDIINNFACFDVVSQLLYMLSKLWHSSPEQHQQTDDDNTNITKQSNIDPANSSSQFTMNLNTTTNGDDPHTPNFYTSDPTKTSYVDINQFNLNNNLKKQPQKTKIQFTTTSQQFTEIIAFCRSLLFPQFATKLQLLELDTIAHHNGFLASQVLNEYASIRDDVFKNAQFFGLKMDKIRSKYSLEDGSKAYLQRYAMYYFVFHYIPAIQRKFLTKRLSLNHNWYLAMLGIPPTSTPQDDGFIKYKGNCAP